MRTLHIDIETYCDLDLSACGVYPYASHPSFEIILLAYAFDDQPPRVLEGDQIVFLPDGIEEALLDPDTLKIAHNANFEIECISRYFNLPLDRAQWFCTMIAVAYLGLPLKLEKVAEVLRLGEQKDSKGKALIAYFCKPCKPTKSNGGRVRNLSSHDRVKWFDFADYCLQDVRTEQEVYAYVTRFAGLSDQERAYWMQDQRVNARGITVDAPFVRAAIEANISFTEEVRDEIAQITGVANPNSLAQLKGWLQEQLGYEVPSLAAESLDDLMQGDMPPQVARLLELRKMGSKTSTSKYDAMLNFLCEDGRIRGLVQFYGANRTGRFAGRGVQIQNLKRTLKRGQEVAREAVRAGASPILYADVAEILSRLVRTALVAAPGCSLVVADYAAIEARVIAWIAGEQWALDVFASHGRIYEATAAQMFNVPLDLVTKGSDLRSRGKVATLALGYQGGAGALVAMGAVRQGIPETELPAIVRAWRSANPKIVRLWRMVEDAALRAIKGQTTHTIELPYCSLGFMFDRGYLFIQLPSGRRLAYYGATSDKKRLSYWGMDQTTKQWRKTDTYGGSLVENIVQAVARDCLTEAMLRMECTHGTQILMHVHDEVVAECPDSEAAQTLEAMYNVMCRPPEWAQGLPIKGDGYISKFYKKD